MFLFCWLARLGRALGILSSPPAPEAARAARVAKVGRAIGTFSATLIDVWRVDSEGWPAGPDYAKLADVRGLGSAMMFARAHARQINEPGLYALNGPHGPIAVVRVDADFLLHVEEWCDERLWVIHAGRKRSTVRSVSNGRKAA